MTDPRRLSHEAAEELISAALTGDLTDAERSALDAHLAGCARCRDTAAAFADSRRLLSGVRVVPPPRDLGARVRSGIEGGRLGRVPWWRRPAFALAGTVALAAAVVGLAVFIGLPKSPPPVASASATASTSPSASASASTPAPSASPTPLPSVPPVANPAAELRSTLVNGTLAVELRTRSGTAPLEGVVAGPIIHASRSPSGEWIAFRVAGEPSGLDTVYAARVADGKVVPLGHGVSVSGSPFSSELAWSPDGTLLAFTLRPEAGGTQVWVFSTAADAAVPLTAAGGAPWFAASFDAGQAASALWVSTFDGSGAVASYRVPLAGAPGAALDPSVAADTALPGGFLPLVAPDGAHAIYWRGAMGSQPDDVRFVSGGMPYLATIGSDGTPSTDAQQLFSDITLRGPDAFAAARIGWGPDGDAIAVWDAEWTGTPEGADYPSVDRVYLAHAANPGLVTQATALDAGDLGLDGGDDRVVDVQLSPDGRHLAITVFRSPGAEGGTYGTFGDLVIVGRNTGAQADEVDTSRNSAEAWNGPGLY